jgi:membrane-associated HD superfamily phosphohydrolase
LSVESIIIDRMMDGQLSNAPLTLQDLDVIRASFVKSLLGMSHKRIRYSGTEAPTPPEQGS